MYNNSLSSSNANTHEKLQDGQQLNRGQSYEGSKSQLKFVLFKVLGQSCGERNSLNTWLPRTEKNRVYPKAIPDLS